MARGSTEQAAVDAAMRPVYPRFYHVRRPGRIVFTLDTLLDGEALSEALTATSVVDNGVDPPYSVLIESLGYLANYYQGPHTPDNGERDFAERIDRAMALNTGYATRRYGPIESLSDALGDPIKLRHEFVNALLNVKTWRFSGDVDGVGFDEVAAAGTFYGGSGTDWRTLPEGRQAWGTRASIDAGVSVLIGTATNPVAILDRFHASPSAFQLMPLLEISIDTPDGRVVSAGHGAFGALEGTDDPEVTFLGRTVRTYVSSGTPTGYSLAISPASWWTDEDEWWG